MEKRAPTLKPKNLPAIIRRVGRTLGINRAILFSIFNTARAVFGGSLIAFLIALHFTPVVQGFYYTFASVLALQVFVEMGLSTVLLQFAAHEWTGLKYGPKGITGNPDNISRLTDIVRLAACWYGIAAVVSTVALMAGGYWFFKQQEHTGVQWALPWLTLCGLTGVKLFISPFLSILEGSGQLQQVYGYRLTEGVLALAVAASAILAGAGLWTAVLVSAAIVSANIAFICGRYGAFFKSLLVQKITTRISWRDEMFPMQWRIAISWMSGYFIFQLFTPVLFNYQGPVAAGQFGLTWSLANAVSGVSAAWINTKVPLFGALIAQRDYSQLDQLATRAALGAVAVATATASAALLVLFALKYWCSTFADRFLPINSCAVLLAAVVLTQILNAQSSYLRAHKKEPFLGLSVGSAVLIGASTWYLGGRCGAAAMVWGYLAVTTLFSIPAGTMIFLRCRREWHTPS